MTTLLSSAIRNVSLMAIAMLAISSSVSIGQEPKPIISVTGEADMNLAADRAIIQASIESRAKTAADACKDNREKSNELIEFLKLQSVEETLISSDLLSIAPIFPATGKGSQKIPLQGQNQSADDIFADSTLAPVRTAIGYRATRTFNIVVKDLKNFEAIYQGIVEKGVNHVEGVTYRSSQEKAHREKLRLQAVRVAKEKAEAIAHELGATLSAIKSVSNSTSGSAHRRTNGYGGGMGSSDPFGSSDSSGASQQIVLHASVDVVFYLGDADFKEKK